MSKPRIAFVTGGYSGEAEISYKSAVTISANIDRDKYEAYTIDVRTDGWWYTDPAGVVHAVDKNDFSVAGIHFDAVLIGIHGTPGEDGKLQGYFDMLGLPYTSCDAATSALTFNKRFTVAVAGMGGIHVARSVLLVKDLFESPETQIKGLRFPVFVKPNNGGSSIATSKVLTPSEELGTAIEKAFGVDSQVLVEEFIEGRELTVGVFRREGEVVTLPITEIRSKNAFFDFEAKYLGASEEITPAEVPETMAEKTRAAARKVYGLLNCRGIVRIDFIYNEQVNEPFLLEVNTVPGQSEASIVPQQVKAAGWSLKEFYSFLIDEALATGR
ncbi:D-alanine--D-alanine ligase [Dinghuibacter silviterrae]|uniref:D-alanine--D-alanine ligase n=1 Tax=Dinghuibacter silviterrae TaxID=1539049 RepID=A0A4R8DF16_9BACT|nr:D-alanine--D-alanine ligase [Dinghuibacter silviterrae]TDW96007.1 D-alanine-D-alanine ligase [Dinghuibacter silviterrae]